MSVTLDATSVPMPMRDSLGETRLRTALGQARLGRVLLRERQPGFPRQCELTVNPAFGAT